MSNQVYAAQDLKYQAQPGINRIGLGTNPNVPVSDDENLVFAAYATPPTIQIPGILDYTTIPNQIKFLQSGAYSIVASIQVFTATPLTILTADAQISIFMQQMSLGSSDNVPLAYTRPGLITLPTVSAPLAYVIYNVSATFYAGRGDIMTVNIQNYDATGGHTLQVTPAQSIITIQKIY